MLELEIDSRTMSVIEDLKKASGKQTAAEVLLDALRLYDWARQQYDTGYSIGAIKDGRAVKEVDLPLRRSTQAS